MCLNGKIDIEFPERTIGWKILGKRGETFFTPFFGELLLGDRRNYSRGDAIPFSTLEGSQYYPGGFHIYGAYEDAKYCIKRWVRERLFSYDYEKLVLVSVEISNICSAGWEHYEMAQHKFPIYVAGDMKILEELIVYQLRGKSYLQ